MRTHPQAIVGGALRDNELYALTNDFLRGAVLEPMRQPASTLGEIPADRL